MRTDRAGTEGQLAHLLRWLPAAGHQLQLISFQASTFLSVDAPRLFPEVRFKVLDGSGDISNSLPALIRLLKNLRLRNSDVVHTYFPASNSFGVLIARLAGIRRLVSSRRDMGYALTKKDYALLRLANCFVSRIVVNAKAVRDVTVQKERVRPEKVVIIHNGVGACGAANGTLPFIPVVGIVSNLNRTIKRLDVFVRAAAIVKARRPETRFWIIGEGNLRPELEALAEKLIPGQWMEFLGKRCDVENILPTITVGVLSSDSEGLSNSLIEYMRAGLPVVATNVGGNAEVVEEGKTGILVRPSDPDQLAAGILSMLEDPEKRRALGAAGRDRALRMFSIEAMVDKTQALYCELLGRCGPVSC